MAIGYGLGIGLQGTPKDYVDIIRSRDAAVAKNAAAKAAREAKKLDRAQEAFTRKLATTKVLAIHQKTVDDLTAQFYDAIDREVDNDTPNINEINRLATEIGNKMNGLSVVKSNWERISKDAVAYGFTPEEANLFINESDPAVWEETLKKSGSGLVAYDPTTNQVSFNPLRGYKSVGQIFNEYTNEGSNSNIYDFNKPISRRERNKSVIEIFAVNPDVADSFAAQNLDNPFIDRDMFVEYRNKGKSLPQIGTPDYATAKATYLKDRFNELSKNFQLERETRPAGQYKTTIINTPAEKSVGSASFEKIENNYLDGAASYNTYGGFTSKDALVIGGSPMGTRNLNTHELFTDAGGELETTTLNIVPVFKKNTPSNIYITKSGIRGDKPITFNAGEIVPTSMEAAQANAGNVEYKLVGIGLGKGSGASAQARFPVQINAESVIQKMNSQLTNEDAKASFKVEIQKLKDKVNKLNGATSVGEY